MKTNVRDLSPSALARIAGVLYLIIAVAAIFAHMLIPEQFIVPGDAAATAANIAANDTLFLIGTVGSELIILLSEVVLTVILYVLLRPVNQTLSLVAAYFLRRSGYLAAVTVHTSADTVWHVIWGLLR